MRVEVTAFKAPDISENHDSKDENTRIIQQLDMKVTDMNTTNSGIQNSISENIKVEFDELLMTKEENCSDNKDSIDEASQEQRSLWLDTTNQFDNINSFEEIKLERDELSVVKEENNYLHVEPEYERTGEFDDETVNQKTRNTDPITERKRGIVWSQRDMKNALEEFKNGKMSERAVALKYNIPRRTLKNHIKSGSAEKRMGRKTIFTEAQEKDLAERIKLTPVGVPLTSKIIRRHAYLFCKEHNIQNCFSDKKSTAGRKWLKNFLARNKDILLNNIQDMNTTNSGIQDSLNSSAISENIQVEFDELLMKKEENCCDNKDSIDVPSQEQRSLWSDTTNQFHDINSFEEIKLERDELLVVEEENNHFQFESENEKTGEFDETVDQNKRNMDPITERKRGVGWSQSDMKNALEELKNGKMSERAVALKYNIPRRTLKNHIKSGSTEKRMGRKAIFTEVQEKDLAERIKFSTVGVPLTSKIIRRHAYLFCEEHNIQNCFSDKKSTAGRKWLKNFLARNKDISLNKTQD